LQHRLGAKTGVGTLDGCGGVPIHVVPVDNQMGQDSGLLGIQRRRYTYN
jgi:hypothetical protein